MKPSALVFVAILAAATVTSFGAESVTMMVVPDKVTLTSGRVLRNVEVIRWEKDRVVLKYTGGTEPIAFSIIAEPLRSQIVALRDETKTMEARARELQKAPAAAKADELTKYQGQVFIVTRGAGNYKMGGITVFVLPENAWAAMEYVSQPIFLPKPLTKVVSDGDGKFEFSLPKGLPFVVLAQGRRLVGSKEELYEWVDRSQDMKQLPAVMLSNDNHISRHRLFRFEGE